MGKLISVHWYGLTIFGLLVVNCFLLRVFFHAMLKELKERCSLLDA